MWLQLVLQAQPGPAGGIAQLVIPFGLMFLVFWFLIIKPQKKEQEEHQNFLNGLKAGDDVVTTGGLFGTVRHVDDKVVTVEIARNTKIKILKTQIQGSQEKHLSESVSSTKSSDKKDDKAEDKKEEDSKAGSW